MAEVQTSGAAALSSTRSYQYVFISNPQGTLPFDAQNVRALLRQVRSGKYVMRDTIPPVIQDLIARMLALDPSERLSIEEIKQHRAFSLGLPEGYVLPRPVAIQLFDGPIVTANLPQEVLTSLQHIGYENIESVKKELSQEGHTMAKVFCAMLTQERTIDSLPWPSQSLFPVCVFSTGRHV
jgi:BR serine/threonine kinase